MSMTDETDDEEIVLEPDDLGNPLLTREFGLGGEEDDPSDD